MARNGRSLFWWALLVCSVALFPGYYVECESPPPEGEVLVTFEVVDDWGEGYEAWFTITNGADWEIDDWVLEFDLSSRIDAPVDDSILIVGTGHYSIMASESGVEDIGPGETVTFGYVGSPGGGVSAPANVLLNGYPVDLGEYAPAPPPAEEVVPDRWPSRLLSPYVDATAWPTYDLVGAAVETGLPYYTLGFIVAAPGTSCTPSWGGYYTMEAAFLTGEVEALRDMGGDVVISFGGAANTELAVSCADESELARAYQQVIDTYGVSRIDFDIEGAWLGEPESVARRARVIADLQAEARGRGERLEVWFTLPVLPTGLTADGVALVETVLSSGVDLGGLNLMAMDYGSGVTGPDPDMGALAMEAADAVHEQLEAVYEAAGLHPSWEELWQAIGVTPMIGANDVPDEVFTLEDGERLVGYALDRGLGVLSYWSANRDQPCEGGASQVSSTCSGVEQERFDFLYTFLPFAE